MQVSSKFFWNFLPRIESLNSLGGKKPTQIQSCVQDMRLLAILNGIKKILLYR